MNWGNTGDWYLRIQSMWSKIEKNMHIFFNWSPIPENLDEEGNDSGPSRPLSHQLTMNEIDTRAREVYTSSLSFLKNS